MPIFQKIKSLCKNIYFSLRRNNLFKKIFRAIVSLERKYILEVNISRRNVFDTITNNNFEVLHGPFKGLKYVSYEAALNALPKILGTYEKELHPVLKRIIESEFDIMLNIGAAEGYYAIGIALLRPKLKIIAFDIDTNVRKMLQKMILLNNVNNQISIEKICNIETLKQFQHNTRGLIISDCEGYELELFQESIIENIRNFDLLIEVHDGIEKNISKTLKKIFKNTHSISIIKQAKRKVQDFPYNYDMPAFDKLASMHEGRGSWIKWMYLKPIKTKP